jgi:uncharacterized membrane protein (UPF0127 family)
MLKWCFHIGLVLMNIGSCHHVGRPATGPLFRKEGDLWFLSGVNGDTIKRIDVEFATTDLQREKGLMYRRNMEEAQGMLFVFAREEEQSFWMKNTYISLDIIYLNEKREVVSVQRNTTPLSEESLPSMRPAKYVLEVNAGFCDRWHVGYGDRIGYMTK